jgi:L-ascorbate metabolism protein UlaG (beta-lactamase superfamily)
LPINGVGNNMNMTDAVRFAERINAEKTVPIHFGMFDALTAHDFACGNKVIPEIYKEIKL